ncbi:MAG: rod shape-determining protein RodA [Rhodothalassiaceae bacterium]
MSSETLHLREKLGHLNWLMVLLLIAIALTGGAMLYSVAGGDWDPWARRQLIRFLPALFLMLAIALTDIRFWLRLAYPIYAGCLVLLVLVAVAGSTGMGGQRWLDLGVMRLQPSELTKVGVVLALARYYHGITQPQSTRLISLIPPLVIIGVPVALVAQQPDLGTALMIVAGGVTVIFLAGAPAWLFIGGAAAAAAAGPMAWSFALHDYQRDRVLTFLNPERDPLGAGYQILQAKIATGSGGLTGKGFLSGTQTQLDFLPEMKTDFIFTVLTEELGLVGAGLLLAAYAIVLGYAMAMAFVTRNHFGRLLTSGLAMTLFLYVLINVAMVTGLVPVVGVPLPMVSYGGSAMLTMMLAYGLILCVAIHRRLTIPRRGRL